MSNTARAGMARVNILNKFQQRKVHLFDVHIQRAVASTQQWEKVHGEREVQPGCKISQSLVL